MTDERAKVIAEEMRQAVARGEIVDNRDLMLLKLYDDIQAIKQAMQGLSFLGVGGGIKPVAKTDG